MSKHTKKPKLFAEYDATDWEYKGWHLYLDDEAKTPVLVLLEPIGGHKNRHGRSPYQELHKDEIIAAYNNTYAAGLKPAAVPLLLAACKEFIRKCECGEAQSRRSYVQMKKAVAVAEPTALAAAKKVERE